MVTKVIKTFTISVQTLTISITRFIFSLKYHDSVNYRKCVKAYIYITIKRSQLLHDSPLAAELRNSVQSSKGIRIT